MFLKPQSKRVEAMRNLSIACVAAGIWRALAHAKRPDSGWDSKT
jgi:hypothetical protein